MIGTNLSCTGTAQVDTVQVEWVTRIPAWLIVIHRLARLGKASRYAPSGRFIQHDIDPVLASKWVDLATMDRVIIIYRERT